MSYEKFGDRSKLPPGWRWDPEAVGYAHFEDYTFCSASASDGSFERVKKEAIDDAWEKFNKIGKPAYESGFRDGLRAALMHMQIHGYLVAQEKVKALIENAKDGGE